MKFVFISDTHGKHQNLSLPNADVMIHAGDVTSNGTEEEVVVFLKWFANLKYKHKIFIAGNHDWFFERRSSKEIASVIPTSVTYLNDSGVTINGINIWGSPVTPWFYNWAFNRRRGPAIMRHWDIIPAATDILVTHGPPNKILDRTVNGDSTGCVDLLNTIHRIQPKVHVFGHIHEGYGRVEKNGTIFINASNVNERYELMNAAVEFEWQNDYI